MSIAVGALKVLIVLTSHSQMGDTGHKTGFWVEEFANPYYTLVDQGVDENSRKIAMILVPSNQMGFVVVALENNENVKAVAMRVVVSPVACHLIEKVSVLIQQKLNQP